MLGRRSRPHTGPRPRAAGAAVPGAAPLGIAPVSADLLPARAGSGAARSVSAPTLLAAPALRLRPRTVDERAGHIHAMARAASRRFSATRG